MPAKSKSQQRLFGMLHAYNKGELKGSKALNKRLSEMSKHISDEDASHFAETKHEGLPEKKAYFYMSAIEKLAAREYSVLSGDTLSGIAKKHNLTTNKLQQANNITDPNRIRIGQKLRIPALGTKTTPTNNSFNQQSKKQVAGSNFDTVSKELHRKFNNPELEAAILANIDRETGGTFDYRQGEIGKQVGGYGLFQYTGKNRTDYFDWLKKNKYNDSAASQITYMKNIYGPSRLGWKSNTLPTSELRREQLSDWWHKRVETPAHVIESHKEYSPSMIAKMTDRHNRFMNGLRLINGTWTRG